MHSRKCAFGGPSSRCPIVHSGKDSDADLRVRANEIVVQSVMTLLARPWPKYIGVVPSRQLVLSKDRYVKRAALRSLACRMAIQMTGLGSQWRTSSVAERCDKQSGMELER